MLIKRNVYFSAVDEETGEEKLFSVNEIMTEEEYLERLYSETEAEQVEFSETTNYEDKNMIIFYWWDQEDKRWGFNYRDYHFIRRINGIWYGKDGQNSQPLPFPKEQLEFVLDKPNVGLVIPPNVWADLTDFKEDTVLVVMASEEYSKIGYIHNYQEFKQMYGRD